MRGVLWCLAVASDKALGPPICACQWEAGASGPQSLPDLRGWGSSSCVSLPLIKLQEGLLGVLMIVCLEWMVSLFLGKGWRQMFCVR